MNHYIPDTHILWVEYRCQHCGKLPPDFYLTGKVINQKYMRLFNTHSRIRERYGHPLLVTRGYSCEIHQLHIFLRKVRAKYGEKLTPETIVRIINDPTMTPFSVHIFGIALDIKPPKKDLAEMRKIILETEPELRIGKSYTTHIHIDRGFEIDPQYSEKLRQGARW